MQPTLRIKIHVVKAAEFHFPPHRQYAREMKGYKVSRCIAPPFLILLKRKRNLLYKRNQSVPRSKHFPPVIKTSQLMMYKAKAAVCSDILTKHSKQSERHIEFFNVKPGGT